MMKTRRTPATMASTTLAAVGLSLLFAPSASADLQSDLLNGNIVAFSLVQHDGDVKPGRAMALVAAPAEVVTKILADVNTYKEFVPRITGSRKVKDGRFVVECTMPWPVSKTWAYVKINKGIRQGVHTLTWKMTNGTLKHYEGVAWIQPMGQNLALLTYQMLAVPHTKAPDSLLTNGLRTAVRDMVKAVRQRAKQVMADRGKLGVRMAAR